MIFNILLLLLLIFIVFAYDYYIHHRRSGRLINLIPGINVPIFGSLMLCQYSDDVFWQLVNHASDEYYPIFRIWKFFTPYVLIRHPDDLKTVLYKKYINKGGMNYILTNFCGTGLVTSEGAKWQSRRNMLSPMFDLNILQQFVEILINESQSMTKSLKDVGSTVVKDLISFVSEHMLNAMCEITMGTSLQDLDVYQQQYRKAFFHMNGCFSYYRFGRPWIDNNWIFPLTSKGKEATMFLKIIHGFTDQKIAERKLYHEHTNGRYLKNFPGDTPIETNEVETIGIRRKRFAMLDFLIAASRKNLMTDLDIREEINTFMHEGVCTTSYGISFLLALLAEHKDIQDCVRNEVDTALRENEEKLTVKLLQNLPYLDRCIMEALRLYPSKYRITRTLTKDMNLHSYLVPAGTFVFLNIYGTHRDPNFWPNPEIFDPDRFLPEKILNRHPYSYLPFGAGSRNCIGQQFAMLGIKAMIIPLIRYFYLEPVDHLKNRIQISPEVSSCSHRIRFVPI